jgi:hypothetical protein
MATVKSDGEQVPVSVCRGCGKPNDMRTKVGEMGQGPKEGTISICFTCGHITMFAEDLTLRELTDEEMVDIAGDPEIIRVQKARAEYWERQRDPHPKIAWHDGKKVAVANCPCSFCFEEFKRMEQRKGRWP